MKKLIYVLTILSLIVFPLSTAHAALAKTVVEVDPWTAIAQNTVVEGATVTVSAYYQTTLYIDAALTSTTAQANGTEIRVQVSSATSGDNKWHELAAFGGPVGTGNSEAITNNPLAAGSTTITCASTTGYTLPTGTDNGLRYIKDATIANSEIGLQTALTANVSITILDGTTTEHANTAVMHNIVNSYTINIPDTANRIRVIYNNTKDAAGSTMDVRARLSVITGI